MIDNIDLIKPLLTFDNEGDFYQLFVFLRKKDQPDGEKDNHQSVRTIKSYTVTSHRQEQCLRKPCVAESLREEQRTIR